MENQLKQNDLKNIKKENNTPYIPKILYTKVYFGLSDKDGEKKPDPTKILFYEMADGSCYDCENQQWMAKRPSICDHLSSREIEASEQDLIAAIIHGIMNDEDYDALNQNGIISEMPKKLWENIKKLKSLNEQLSNNSEYLQKVENKPFESKYKETFIPDEGLYNDVYKSYEDEVSNFNNDFDDIDENRFFEEDSVDEDNMDEESIDENNMDEESIDENNMDEESINEKRLPGEDIVSQIISRTMAEADDRIRQIIREEISGFLSKKENNKNQDLED